MLSTSGCSQKALDSMLTGQAPAPIEAAPSERQGGARNQSACIAQQTQLQGHTTHLPPATCSNTIRNDCATPAGHSSQPRDSSAASQYDPAIHADCPDSNSSAQTSPRTQHHSQLPSAASAPPSPLHTHCGDTPSAALCRHSCASLPAPSPAKSRPADAASSCESAELHRSAVRNTHCNAPCSSTKTADRVSTPHVSSDGRLDAQITTPNSKTTPTTGQTAQKPSSSTRRLLQPSGVTRAVNPACGTPQHAGVDTAWSPDGPGPDPSLRHLSQCAGTGDTAARQQPFDMASASPMPRPSTTGLGRSGQGGSAHATLRGVYPSACVSACIGPRIVPEPRLLPSGTSWANNAYPADDRTPSPHSPPPHSLRLHTPHLPSGHDGAASPQAGCAVGSAGRQSHGDALLAMVQRERAHAEAASARCKDLQTDLEEMQASYEVRVVQHSKPAPLFKLTWLAQTA